MAVQRVTPYGLKEVADVYFFPAESTVTILSASASGAYAGYISCTTDPDFIFDTLKVSNIEVTSEETTATGGRGNPELMSWSYGKEITFTMEDAVFSMATLDLMFGANASVDDFETTDSAGNISVGPSCITIDSDTFPCNYHIVGFTYIRNQKTGKDQPFLFEIPNGKVNVGGTLTMEADGDPTTFEMTIKALKAEGKTLVKFYHLNVNSSEQVGTHESNNVQSTT